MTKRVNEADKPAFDGVDLDTLFSAEVLHRVEYQGLDGDSSFAVHTNIGSLTVVDRMTGFGFRDVESGFRDPDGKFWLASGDCDIRKCGCRTFGEVIAWVKQRANSCVGI